MSDVRTARNLISVVELVGVRLVDVHATTRVSSSREIPPVTIALDYKSSVSEGDEAGIFLILASIDVKIKPPDGEEKPLVRIRTKLELRYRVPSDFVLVKKELNAFGRVNAVYNAWPYFREIVQNMTGRMDLPPLILPVFRIPRPKRPRAQSQHAVAGRERSDSGNSKAASDVTN